MAAETETNPVVIIGAGPAGLAVAAQLQKRNIRNVVLESGSGPASALRGVDPDMRLLSPTSLSMLPGMQRRVDEPAYLPFRDLVKELEFYAQQHQLEIKYEAEVHAVARSREGFTVSFRTSNGREQSINASQVVNATGIISHPQLPDNFHQEGHPYRWLHSLDTRAEDLKQARKLLVVGGGASAAEVLERWLEVRQSGDKAWLSVRSSLRAVPHWILGIDIHYLVWLPEQLPTCLLGWRAGRLHEPMTGLSVCWALCRKIITRVPGVTNYDGDSVLLADGRRLKPDLVVFATGFNYDTEHLNGLLEFDPDGRPKVYNLESTRTPGLYLLGYRFGRTFASPYLRGIARDAQYVARQIAERRK